VPLRDLRTALHYPVIGTVAQETEILTQTLAFADDPLGFVLYMYPWGEPGTPLERFKGPRAWQREELEAIGEHTRKQRFAFDNDLPLSIYHAAYSAGRGPGKTTLNSWLAHWGMSTHPGSSTIVAANTESQLRSNFFPELGIWLNLAVNGHWFNVDTMRVSMQSWLTDIVRKRPQAGGLGIDPGYWYISGRMWSAENPDGFRGPHNQRGMTVIFEEASGIPEAIWDITSGFFTDPTPYRYWQATSQMSRRGGKFFSIFFDDKHGIGWRHRTIDIVGMDGIDQAKVAQDIARHGEDSDYVRVHIKGLPPLTSEDQFIPYDAVRAAQLNDFGFSNHDTGEALVLGVDPAPRGKTAWQFRQGRNARDCCGAATHGIWEGLDNVQIAEKILDFDSKYKPDHICIDFGMGTGVIDILKRKRLHGRLHVVRFGDTAHDGKDSEFATHAAELWARVRDWLPGGMIVRDAVDKKDTLAYQLVNRGWRYSGREDGKKILETKEDLHKRGVPSPDKADALGCTFEQKEWPRVDYVRRGSAPLVAEGADEGMFASP